MAPSAAPRTRLTPEDRRAQLVALGVESLVDLPLHSLSIEQLSQKAGGSRALLFHYFGSKQGLHREVVSVARDSMLHATAPTPGLEPHERLHDTLTRIVRFVREHRGTFYSLVRGVASADLEVREVVEDARIQQADRVIAVFLELGLDDTPLLRTALRSWVAFAEETLVSPLLDSPMPSEEIVLFLERSARSVAEAVGAASLA